MIQFYIVITHKQYAIPLFLIQEQIYHIPLTFSIIHLKGKHFTNNLDVQAPRLLCNTKQPHSVNT